MKEFQISNFKFQILFLFLLVTCHLSLVTAVNADEIKARSAVVIDANSDKVLFAKNPDLKLPAASTVKVMTAIVAAEHADMEKVTTMSRRASLQQPTKTNLKSGDRIKIKDLLYAALMESANDAATALAESVTGSEVEFVGLMNKKAFELGATSTKYINANGLPGKGQYTTASDLAKIMQHALKIPVIREVFATRVKEINTVDGKTIYLRNTNKLLWESEDVVGGKTGFTRMARHCFVAALNKGNTEVITAVLGSPSRQYLWTESERLLEKGLRVSNMEEEPVIYRAPERPAIKKVSLKKTLKTKRHKKSLRNAKKRHRANQKVADGRDNRIIQG
ncbi:MAG: D-alanyl-D-alanine carboxypeptidase [Nitrospirae bacterium]|nr:D-alanyl-D-alanine carboxypeptidase [Nitrospirota bacterium]